ncbi:hypothetical protein BSKO_11597 [Bryopsis sp. KO-2023]|nr:hypothetical protein BSKO_11597 [Bryopsis sp. KO-2023]
MDSVVDPDIPDYTAIPWGKTGRTITLGLVSLFSKAVLHVMNSTTFVNEARMHELAMRRPEGVGLITVCNHTSTFDDPGVVSNLVPWSYFLQEGKYGGIRWTFCAADICFRNEFLRQFFITGKTLPVERGGGLDQPSLHQVAEMVKRGDWAHVFPEGRVSFTGKVLPMKWGVGKMVCDSLKEDGSAAIVLPFFHSGMGAVMPNKARFPRAGNQVEVVIGEPIDLSDLTCKCNQKGNPHEAWQEITQRIETSLKKMEENAKPNRDQTLSNPS